jgi:hypothetical protein
LRDIGSTDLKSALEYGLHIEVDRLGFTGNLNQANDLAIKMRGLRRASPGRNNFEWSLSSDVYITGLFTFSRGPNSVIFGVAVPEVS